MYKVDTFYNNDEQTSIPDVMYSCRNYHNQVWFIKLKGKGKNDKIPNAESDPLAALERKQNEIFSRLQCLRDTVKQLSTKYTMSTAMTSSKTAVTSSKSVQGTSSDQSSVPLLSQQKLNLGDVIHDLVVSADPDSPPLSLLVLYRVASEMFKVFATSYVHSSVVGMPQNLREVFQNGGCTNRDGNEVAFTLLWKKVQNGPTLMVNPHKQTVIEGESNIARYIQRLINPDFDKCVVGATRIDEWLDLAEQYVRGNKKENAAVLKSLNSKLGSAEWLVGNALSLADIVMWSVINQSKGQKDSPLNVKNWLQRCDRNPYFELANGAL